MSADERHLTESEVAELIARHHVVSVKEWHPAQAYFELGNGTILILDYGGDMYGPSWAVARG